MMQTRAYVYVCVYHENVTTRSRTVTIEIAMGEYYSRWEMQNTMINGIDGFSRPFQSPRLKEYLCSFFFLFKYLLFFSRVALRIKDERRSCQCR